MKGVYIFLSDGFEDVEALGTRDVLSRGGVDVCLVGIGDSWYVKSSHGVCVRVDCLLCDLEDSGDAGENDFFIFPGGMPGSRNLAGCRRLINLMNSHYAQGGSIAAICAAPGLVLSQLKGIRGAEFTCFDGFEGALQEQGCRFIPAAAVTSGRIITGRSAGWALDFGLEILKKIKGADEASRVRGAIWLNTSCR